MNLTVSGKIRNYIFIVVLGVAVISLIAAFLVAAGQDKAFRDNYQLYQQATSLMKGEKYAQAEVLLTQMDQTSQDSYQVLYMFAMCSGGVGDYSTAINYLQRTQETRPALLMNQTFLMQYGKFLYLQGEYTTAKLYLLESQKYNTNPAAANEADNYQLQIDAKEKGGGKS